MTKAQFTTKTGTVITIEGTEEEIVDLIAKFDVDNDKPKSKVKWRKQHASTAKSGPVNLISELVDGGFFKKPKELGAIKTALEEQGHYYPVTTLSPILLRMVRKRELRRIKDNRRWLYVG